MFSFSKEAENGLHSTPAGHHPEAGSGVVPLKDLDFEHITEAQFDEWVQAKDMVGKLD